MDRATVPRIYAEFTEKRAKERTVDTCPVVLGIDEHSTGFRREERPGKGPAMQTMQDQPHQSKGLGIDPQDGGRMRPLRGAPPTAYEPFPGFYD